MRSEKESRRWEILIASLFEIDVALAFIALNVNVIYTAVVVILLIMAQALLSNEFDIYKDFKVRTLVSICLFLGTFAVNLFLYMQNYFGFFDIHSPNKIKR
jgi:hypothetical protein